MQLAQVSRLKSWNFKFGSTGLSRLVCHDAWGCEPSGVMDVHRRLALPNRIHNEIINHKLVRPTVTV